MKIGLREVVFVILLMGIPIGAWWFVFRPRNAREAEIRSQIEAKQAKLQALNHATATLGNLKKEIDSLEKAVAFFHSKLPNEKEIDKVLQEIWRLAESSQLTTKSIRVVDKASRNLPVAAGGGYAEQPISVQLEGSFLGLYTFLQALENQPRIMRIHNLSVTKSKKGPEGHVEASFVMSIFFEQEKKDSEWRTQI